MDRATRDDKAADSSVNRREVAEERTGLRWWRSGDGDGTVSEKAGKPKTQKKTTVFTRVVYERPVREQREQDAFYRGHFAEETARFPSSHGLSPSCVFFCPFIFYYLPPAAACVMKIEMIARIKNARVHEMFSFT